MGFDKPDLGFVVHLGAPQSPIAYYQQIGRAGRAVDRADVILLPGREDADIWAYFGSLAFPAEAVVRRTLSVLAAAGRPLSTAALEASVDLSRTRLETMLKVLDVDGAVRRVTGGWTTTGQEWAYDADRYARVAAERAREQEAMLAYIATAGCRMEYLRRQLDDPAAAPCGRCDNCTQQRWPAAVTETAARAARDHLLRPGTEIPPRKMWPTGMGELGIDVAGKIGADISAEAGRALGRLTDLGWGPRLRAMLAGEPPAGDGARQPAGTDGPVSGDMLAAVVKVLAAWDWARRPSAVVAMPSQTRPLLIASLAGEVAKIGRMPYLGPLDHHGPARPARQHNSAQRLRAVWNTLVVPGAMHSDLARLDGPVLLVDDRIDTGWTMTVAAMRLREAGAIGVLPLVLAIAA
jgi:ATP-dependent DNA helicase RecQ